MLVDLLCHQDLPCCNEFATISSLSLATVETNRLGDLNDAEPFGEFRLRFAKLDRVGT
jgi:hypothetical protein